MEALSAARSRPLGADAGGVVSVLNLLTALHPDLALHVDDTARSVERLRSVLPPEWTVRWVVVFDGEASLQVPGADVVVAQSRPSGVAATRNLALSHAVPGWVFRLDGDDVLDVPGWLELLDHPLFGSTPWHPTNMLTTEGEQTAHWFDEERLWLPGEVEEAWTSPFPFHPNNIVVETGLALASGGWPALRVNEDLGWCFSVATLAPGTAIPAVTMRYRRWEGQTVADPSYVAEKEAAFRFLAGAVNARRARLGLPPVTPPPSTPGVLYVPR